MAVSAEFRDYVSELLEPLGPVSVRRMFGGLGVFYGDIMFGLVASDILYFKVDDGTRGDFEAAGMGPFEYGTKGGRRGVMSYYQVPADLMEDGEAILQWARRAVDVALGASRAKAARKRRRAPQCRAGG